MEARQFFLTDPQRQRFFFGLTTSVVVVVCEKLPFCPVIVSVALPGGVLLLVCTVNMEVPDPVIDVGFNEAVAPAGRPLTDKFTVPVNPFGAVSLTV